MKDGHWPTEYLVYFVPSRREDLHDGVGEEDEEEGEDAVGRLVRVPEAHRQDYVCKKIGQASTFTWTAIVQLSNLGLAL